MKDLIILTADKNTKFLLQGLLPRFPKVLNINEFSYDIEIHLERDPGCRISSHEFLRTFINDYNYAVVIFDYEGCGNVRDLPEEIENEIEKKLSNNGWENRNSVILINPEVENWVWVKSRHLADVLEFDADELDKWLIENNYIKKGMPKPFRPKEAFESALRKNRIQRSSSIYEELAQRASFKDCTDVAFNRFKNQLIEWFKKK